MDRDPRVLIARKKPSNRLLTKRALDAETSQKHVDHAGVGRGAVCCRRLSGGFTGLRGHRSMHSGQSLQVQHPSHEERLLADTEKAATTEAAQAMTILGFPKQLFDLLASPLRKLVRQATDTMTDSGMSATPRARSGCDVWLDLTLEQRLDERLLEEALVCAKRLGRPAQSSLRALQQR